MIVIPTLIDGTEYDYRFDVRIDDSDFTIRLLWNPRTEYWSLSLYDVFGEPIVEGRTVSLLTDLLRGAVGTNRPAGKLYAHPVDGVLVAPGLTELGGRVVLCYG